MANTTARPAIPANRTRLEEEAAKGFELIRHTELGKRLIAARASYLAEHGRFLTREEFEREWARERGTEFDGDE